MTNRQEHGGVSLFIVIFTTIIITIVTVSFTQLMIHNQQQATANDLSQRAYNSALAGVEDAKRVLVSMQEECNGGSAEKCTDLTNAVSSQKCDTLSKAGITGVTSGGIYQETTVGNTDDNQAYTCVKIDTKTKDYEGSLKADESTVIPLFGSSNFNEITVTWFTHDDSGQDDADQTVNLFASTPPGALPPQSVWGSQTPSLLRAQYIPGSVSTSDLDDDAKTTFLYPSTVGTDVTVNALDRRDPSIGSYNPHFAGCETTYQTAAGACRVKLKVSSTRKAYLQLSALYNATHFTIKLSKSGRSVTFDGVQPKVDSTGRAADLFRRVVARVKVSGVSLPYPNASVNTRGDFCKDFSLKDSDGNTYQPSTTGQACDPASGV